MESDEDVRRDGPFRAGAYQWTELMRRTFGFDVLPCPGCDGRLRVSRAHKRYGFDTTNMIERMEEGIRQGWEPDDGVSAVFGALRWYHRKTGGANPSIVELYHPIVDAYIK